MFTKEGIKYVNRRLKLYSSQNEKKVSYIMVVLYL